MRSHNMNGVKQAGVGFILDSVSKDDEAFNFDGSSF